MLCVYRTSVNSLRKLLDIACRSEHFIGTGPHPYILGEILPAHRSRAVHQELCGTRDVVPVGPSAGVQQTIAPDELRIGIGQNCKRQPRLAAKVSGDLWSIDANRYRPNATCPEFLKLLLDAP
jgi:hypothetical protein